MIQELFLELLHHVPQVAGEVALALAPVIAVFAIFQITLLRLPKSRLLKMAMGMVYAFIGLVLFFLGIEIGFTDVGSFLGEQIGALSYNWILVPIGLGIGFSVVLAEPAVRSLVHQVETVSGGMIHKAAIYVSLCISVALAVAMAMFRAVWGISFWAFIIPGYAIALLLAKFTSPLFTAIAFDAGGVATGPMTSTFVLSFTVGVTSSIASANSVTDAFGVVALVAMMPLITVQILGLIFAQKTRMAEKLLQEGDSEEDLVHMLDDEDDDEFFGVDDFLLDNAGKTIAAKDVLDKPEQSVMMDAIHTGEESEENPGV